MSGARQPVSRWAIRAAVPGDAEAACAAIRASIVELCLPDHDGDPAVLGPWLQNKRPEVVRRWIEADPRGNFVAAAPGGTRGIGGMGTVMPDGRIALNYVAPWARFQGVSRGLVGAMEARAAAMGHGACTLVSTATARRFYRACGYEDDGAPVGSFGGKPAFPMRRAFVAAG